MPRARKRRAPSWESGSDEGVIPGPDECSPCGVSWESDSDESVPPLAEDIDDDDDDDFPTFHDCESDDDEPDAVSPATALINYLLSMLLIRSISSRDFCIIMFFAILLESRMNMAWVRTLPVVITRGRSKRQLACTQRLTCIRCTIRAAFANKAGGHLERWRCIVPTNF